MAEYRALRGARARHQCGCCAPRRRQDADTSSNARNADREYSNHRRSAMSPRLGGSNMTIRLFQRIDET